MTYLIEFLGEFEFIFETVLGYVSGDQMGSFEAKKRSRKSHAWAPLRHFLPRLIGPYLLWMAIMTDDVVQVEDIL